MVAGFDTSIDNPEEIEPEDELNRMNGSGSLPVTLKFPGGKLKKEPDKWDAMTNAVIGNLSHIRSVCSHCDKFLISIESRALNSDAGV
ncbi:hypothetical protein MMIC_P2471 [Mariprofundus micogutta]|uniref:Uncharacterized protein n=1 Tax=Mariprofundus micogutta TaxID=1921010 RepID=A0A1L8CRC4_9PROT|nr:hypothetical protein MMIC_P2471 [Mariprofundus micogutta]